VPYPQIPIFTIFESATVTALPLAKADRFGPPSLFLSRAVSGRRHNFKASPFRAAAMIFKPRGVPPPLFFGQQKARI
jgi:hypothetical protein